MRPNVFKNTEPRVFALEALVLAYSFTAAAFHSDWPSVSNDPGGLARLAIPVTAALAGLLLRDVCADSDRPPYAAALDAMVAFGLAIVAELILFTIEPGLVLPRWAPTQGGFVGLSLLVVCRSLFSPRSWVKRSSGPLSASEVQWRAEDLRRTGGRRMRAYLAASTLFGAIALWFLVAGGVRARFASGLVLAGSVYLTYQIRRKMVPATACTDASRDTQLLSYVQELQHQRTILHSVAYWCCGSLLTASLISLWGAPVYPYWIPVVFLIGAELNLRAIEGLANELCSVRTR